MKRSVKSIIERSFVLQQLIEKGEIGIIGAMHNIETGEVNFYEDAEFINDENSPNFTLNKLKYLF